jgi:Big-like domain-containing protein
MSWLGGWFDPELEELFRDDPELLETAKLVRAARPQSDADPRFRNRLRAQLAAEASRGRGAFGMRRRWHFGPAHAAWGGAVVGVALIGATVLTLVANHPIDRTISAISDIAAQHAVSPNHVITVAFNQPMDEQAVQRGVRIQPATKVSFSWQNNTLLISPVYHLTGNTPYTVTFAKSALRTASGVSATAPITLTFGTAPTPPVTGTATPASLTPLLLGSTAAGGSLLFAPDGSVVSTAGLPPPSASSSAAATATPTAATPTPTATPTSTPTSTPTPEGVIPPPDTNASLVVFPPSGTPVVLGPASTAAAYSPNGTTLATAVDDGNGGSEITVSLSNGSQRQRLADSPTPVTALTWSSNDRIVYTDGTSINSVDRARNMKTLYSVSGGGTITALDPGGAYAYVAPQSGNGGSLVNIAAGTTQLLHGSVTDVAFSGDGSTVAWVDESTSKVRLFTEAVGQDAPSAVPMLDSSATIEHIALDRHGDEAAFLMTDVAKSTKLVVAQLPSGTPLAVGPADNATTLVLSPGGDQLAYISNKSDGSVVEQAAVPGSTLTQAGTVAPAAANSTLRAFVDAQVSGDFATLASLSGRGVDAVSNTPHGLSRAYVISTYLTSQGLVSASVELIVDPTADHSAPGAASETLSLTRSSAGGGYVVSNIVTTPLVDESSGPHVVQVSSTTGGGVTTLQVSFDGDLNPASVAGAISVQSSQGTLLQSTAVYDPGSRTVTVTVAQAASGALTLAISTALADVNGQPVAAGFETTVGTTA